MNTRFRILIVALLLGSVTSTGFAQRDARLQQGRFEGTAWNTTTPTSGRGDALIVVSNVDALSGKLKFSMSFSKGLCGQGISSGTLEKGVVNLFGHLSSHDHPCGDQSWNMVTRCKLATNESLSCEYWLYPETGTSVGEQKGNFEVQRIKEAHPVSSSGSSVSNDIATPRRQPEPGFFPGTSDPGVDVAIVKVNLANLRKGPSTSNGILFEVKRGTRLVLVDRSPEGPWYNVIDVESGLEGWINGNGITLLYTRKKSTTRSSKQKGLIPTVTRSSKSAMIPTKT